MYDSRIPEIGKRNADVAVVMIGSSMTQCPKRPLTSTIIYSKSTYNIGQDNSSPPGSLRHTMAPSRAFAPFRLLRFQYRTSPSSNFHLLAPSTLVPRTPFTLPAQRCISISLPRHVQSANDGTGVDPLSSSTPTPSPPDYLNEAELQIYNKLSAALQPTKLEVQDISGGCGSMYGLDIVSGRFAGLSVIKQHKMVNEVLKEEIKGWHGVQLKTKVKE